MKLPFVSRKYAERLEWEIEYRDAALKQMRRERDAAQEQAQRAIDELIVRLGCAPVTPLIVAENAERSKEVAKIASDFQAALDSVDAENRYINEQMN